MSLKTRKAREKAKKHKDFIEAFYADMFQQIQEALNEHFTIEDENYRINFMFNTLHLWDEFALGKGPVKPTKSASHFKCPIMELVASTFNSHICKIMGPDENLDTLNILLSKMNNKDKRS